MQKWCLLFCLFFLPAAIAVPAPPSIIVNPNTRQCASFFPGDECVSCVMPDGWLESTQCPVGHEEVTVTPQCFPQRNYFCCTEGHSGAPGDCAGLVTNVFQKKCAFSACTPLFWAVAETCPLEYGWRDELDCAQPRFPWALVGASVVLLLGWTIWQRYRPVRLHRRKS